MFHHFNFDTPNFWNTISSSKTYKHHHKKGSRKSRDTNKFETRNRHLDQNNSHCARQYRKNPQAGQDGMKQRNQRDLAE